MVKELSSICTATTMPPAPVSARWHPLSRILAWLAPLLTVLVVLSGFMALRVATAAATEAHIAPTTSSYTYAASQQGVIFNADMAFSRAPPPTAVKREAGPVSASRFAAEDVGAAGRTFTHFTDEAGATGIAGSAPASVGETASVGQLQFAKGQNGFLIGEGRIGVTDLGLDATPGELNGIGVFGSKQQFAVQFNELDAFNSGARVTGDLPSRNIFSIPGGCTITGVCSVTRIR